MTYLELAKQSIARMERESDADYHARVEAALGVVCRPDYPAGMIPWLGENRPDLYHQLTSFLPDEIDRLWNEHALLVEFQATLDKLVEVHRLAVLLYRESGPRT